MSTLGTKENPLRILVADNWGQMPHPYMQARYPNCTFKVISPASSMHPHGHMVAECILDSLSKKDHIELTFYPYLSVQAKERNGWMKILRDAYESGNPYHLCNCSFGSEHGDDEFMRLYLDSLFNPNSKAYVEAKKLLEGLPTFITFAAGNSDKGDKDNDINYPQKFLYDFDNIFVIGACGPDTVPSSFSSDGEQVFAMFWGEAVPVYDPVTGRNTFVNGTSFASPFACGDIGSLLVKGEDVTKTSYLNRVLSLGWVMRGWERGKQHRKAGYGCMIPVQKLNLPFNKASMLVDPAKAEGALVTYLDFAPVKQIRKTPFWRRRAWKGARS